MNEQKTGYALRFLTTRAAAAGTGEINVFFGQNYVFSGTAEKRIRNPPRRGCGGAGAFHGA